MLPDERTGGQVSSGPWSRHATQKMIAENIGKSERPVKTLTKTLQEKKLLTRKNGKRNGVWEVLLRGYSMEDHMENQG